MYYFPKIQTITMNNRSTSNQYSDFLILPFVENITSGHHHVMSHEGDDTGSCPTALQLVGERETCFVALPQITMSAILSHYRILSRE